MIHRVLRPRDAEDEVLLTRRSGNRSKANCGAQRHMSDQQTSTNLADGTCPICADVGQLVLVMDGFDIRECAACRHRFLDYRVTDSHVAEIYDEDYFFGGGAGYTNYLDETIVHRKTGSYYGQLLNRYAGAGRRLLDVGAAAGCVMQGLAQAGWQCEGVEPCREIIDHAAADQKIHWTQLDQLSLPDTVDAITMIQVLPHLVELRDSLTNAAKLTSDDGLWLIETWNYRSLTARLCGSNWHEYTPPGVLHWFTPESLQMLCSQFGMTPIAQGRRRKRLSGAHLKSGVRHALRNSPLHKLVSACLSIVPDRAIVPYPSEDLFWMVFRKTSASTG